MGRTYAGLGDDWRFTKAQPAKENILPPHFECSPARIEYLPYEDVDLGFLCFLISTFVFS